MMIRIEHPDFTSRRLKVEAAGWWRRPRLYQRGVPVPGHRGVYLVTTDGGETAPVRLRWDFVDPIPRVRLGQQVLPLARRLRAYEYLWLALPLMLVINGGPFGLVFGAVVMHGNGLLYRQQTVAWRRYLVTGLVTAGAIAVFSFLAVIAQALWHRWRHGAG